MTAYSDPGKFTHGQFPLADQLNALADCIRHVAEKLGAGVVHGNPALPYDMQDVDWESKKRHVHRWLIYVGPTTIADSPNLDSEVTQTVSLPSNQGEPYDFPVEVSSYDLDTVPWMTYGTEYWIFNHWFAVESSEP